MLKRKYRPTIAQSAGVSRIARASSRRELTGSTEPSKFARDRRIAMATTQHTTPITLTLTEQAAVEVRKFMAEEKVAPETAGLRIGVLPAGCSGFRYTLTVEDNPAEDAVAIGTPGVASFAPGFPPQHLNGLTPPS